VTGSLVWAAGSCKVVAFILIVAAARLHAGRRADGGHRPWVERAARRARIDRWFRRLQLASSALYSLGHGSNDAQKTMGIIWLLLIAAGISSSTGDHRAVTGWCCRATSRWAWAPCSAAGAS
jgi:PiT family inorganic phosphate transporter